MESWAADIEFERDGVLRKALKWSVLNPLANYAPAGLLRSILRFGKSELAAANWADPGGWRSMVMSYEGRPTQVADKILIRGGTIPRALRNRRRLAGRLLARLIEQSPSEPAHVLCLGAGPGRIVMDAMTQARKQARATLVDLNSDAFEYGRASARQAGLEDRVRFVQGNACDIHALLAESPDIVKMIGICEYLSDRQILDITSAVAAVMPSGAPIVFNSLSRRHGTDRFFRRVFGLHMTHRSPQQLQSLMEAAGFHEFGSVAEPLGVYHVVVAHKKP